MFKNLLNVAQILSVYLRFMVLSILSRFFNFRDLLYFTDVNSAYFLYFF